MNVLFITASRLGDAVLSTGVLDHILRAHPGARVTVACGALAAPLFDGVPGRVRTIAMKKQSFNRHWLAVWRATVGTHWDIVIDLRDSAVSRLVRAKKRYIFGRHIDRDMHKVAQNGAVIGAYPAPAPRLWLTAAQEAAAKKLVPPGGPVLGVGPTANWIGKTWPAERFIAVIARLTAPDGMMPDARVAVFAAPGEEKNAYEVLASVPQDRQVDVIAKADPGTVAAALARCDFYIGNDSGLMHCAAAAGVPTMGLFGPSWPHLYAPWGAHAAWVSTPQDFAALTAFDGYDPKTLKHSLMDGLSVDAVMAALGRFAEKKRNAAV